MRSRIRADTKRIPVSTGERVFTLAQANRALVLVRRIVTDIVADYVRVLECQEILELEQRYGPAGMLEHVQLRMSTCADRIQGCLIELNDVGVVLRDCSSGMVEFPGRVAGRDVCFAWQLGEDRIKHWRDPHDDTRGWQPICEFPSALPADQVHAD